MQFDPMTEEEVKAANAPLPAGEYDFTVREAVEQLSNSGNEMFSVILDVYDAKAAKHRVRDWIVNAKAGLSQMKLRHFMATIGMLEEYETGEVKDYDLEGKEGKVATYIEQSDKFGEQPRVREYVVPSDYVSKSEKRKQGRKSSEPADAAGLGSEEAAARKLDGKEAAPTGSPKDSEIPF